MRCRLVGRELRAKTKGTFLAHELFIAMPPWESFKVLLGLVVSDDVPGAEKLEIAILDISRAHFMALMDREACIELPQEDKLPEDCDAVGFLLRSVYGGFVQQVQTGKKIGKQRLKLDTRLVWQTPLCSTMPKNVAEAEFTVGSRTGWATTFPANTLCENHTDLFLGITVNATLSC